MKAARAAHGAGSGRSYKIHLGDFKPRCGASLSEWALVAEILYFYKSKGNKNTLFWQFGN
ncbi:hypothetical protein [Allofranklinella schreckenbergeri]|uniref:hypothetical protein n=1 Tax=Allofranklinella schreckenbergeri TaxID=1076744 RepID=UPI0011C47948|nr:hypothetical protein [Allofranklinella schreckenbergeri]